MKFNEVWRTTLMASVLGLGAPVGYLIYSYYLTYDIQGSFTSWFDLMLIQEWHVLFYLTVATVVVFGAFGFYSGSQQRFLARQKRQMEEFLHIAVHDIRSPLAVMKEGVCILQDEILGPINGQQKKVLDAVANQTKVITDLITEILDINRMETGNFKLSLESVVIRDVVEKAVSEMNLLFAKKEAKVDMIFDTPSALHVKLDQFRFRQVVRNLLSNSVKYGSCGGRVEVRISLTDEQDFILDIFNEGPRIPENKIDCIFDKFVQMKKRHQKLGYGLGLAICKNIVDLHGGRIWAENVEEVGVSFKIQLPSKLVLKPTKPMVYSDTSNMEKVAITF